MIAPFSNDQYTQPVAASSEYTNPLSLPTNTRPAATVGCALADTPAGKPKAHFSFSRGTCSAVRPATCADWKRVFELSLPQPFHDGPRVGSVIAGFERH